ncbi:MAG: hypothetical protein V7603_5072 [Micromonosporaceae bacterium]
MTDDIARRARRRTRAVVAGVAAGLLVLGAAVIGLVVALGPSSAGGPVPATTGPAAAVASSAAPPASPSDSTSPSPPVDDMRWDTVAGARVPVSRAAGPADTAGGRARGFAHTPLGAVLAAVHISVRLSPQVGPKVFEPTLREQVVGTSAAALGQHLDEDYQQAQAQLGLPYGQPAGRLYSTTRGYRVDAAADTATVRLLIEGPGASGGSVLVALVTTVQWVGGDWALVAPPGGDWTTNASVVTDTAGYSRFPDGG